MEEQHKRIKKLIEKCNKPDMRKYVRIYNIDTEKCSTSYIRKWNIEALELYKKSKVEKISDIRLFFTRE